MSRCPLGRRPPAVPLGRPSRSARPERTAAAPERPGPAGTAHRDRARTARGPRVCRRPPTGFRRGMDVRQDGVYLCPPT
ncbi:Hypothetical protein SCLAV_1849 [Streptomyces clavuligerus]|uniref:Uncharacterized protein n=1 Tax=Streptomyces clavuligerus TaxID=1901 RepID=E2Q3V4_STRCL|nr:Hypothetical protein SCLAV_1849 [Streptomyces clavuligerus]